MASEDKAALYEKRVKLDPVGSNVNSVRSLNSLFPKIDNLEYFPLKVLLQIFASVDYITLVNLAENSTRFERIAKMVLNERYSQKYLTIYSIKYRRDPVSHVNFFQLFGNEIKSFEAEEHLVDKNEDNWIASALNRMNNLEKLKLMINYMYDVFFLQKYATSRITHLTLSIRVHFDECNGLVLSKFCNLKKLELMHPCISFETLREVIQNNPGLESLCISDKYGPTGESAFGMLRIYPLNELMLLFGSGGIAQLKEFAYVPLHYERFDLPDLQSTRQPDHIVEAFVDSLKYLESLTLSLLAVNFFTDCVELLPRFAQRCKNIKHLKLYHIDDEYDRIFKSIRSFERIESLAITMYDLVYDSIISLVEKLPFLHDLYIEMHLRDVDWSFVLMVLSNCPSLEKLTIASDHVDGDFELLTAAQFYDDFKNYTQLRNVEINVVYRNRVIGKITKDQIVWRNKLLRWSGYDPNLNLSQIHLLDLVNNSAADSNTKCNRIGPFDMIMNYLDLNSLHSLSNTNRKCSELVESYVKRHSKQRGIFTITNEFFTPHNLEYKQLENNFAEHVTNLRVNIYHHNIAELRNIIGQCHNLNKLYVYTRGHEVPSDMIFPHVRHLIYDGRNCQQYSQLYELSRLCPDLEILELLRPSLRNQRSTVERLAFRNLKMFAFNNFFNSWDNVLALFKDTNTTIYDISGDYRRCLKK